MPVFKQKSTIESGLEGMAEVFKGYLQGEAVQRERFVEERDYALTEAKFDENIRQFDASLAEQVREFDTRIAHIEEQAELNREHDIFLQEDQQAHLTVESELDRTLTEEQNAHQRAHDAWKADELNKRKEEALALQASESAVARGAIILGGHGSWDAMPDYYIVGTSYNDLPGRKYSPSELAGMIPGELESWANGKGSDILGGITPEKATEYLERINDAEDPKAEEAAVVQEMLAKGEFEVEENTTYKRQVLLDEAIRREGGQSGWERLSKSEKEDKLGAVMHGLNHQDAAKDKLYREKVAYELAVRETENGSAPLASDMPAAYARTNNQYFVLDKNPGGVQIPRHSGLGGSVIGADMADLLNKQTDYFNVSSREGITEAEAKDELGKLEIEMKRIRDRMRASIKDDGGDPKQADNVYNYMLAVAKKEPADPSIFRDYLVSGRDANLTPSRQGSAQGSTLGGNGQAPQNVNYQGTWYKPSDPLYPQAVAGKKIEEATKARREENKARLDARKAEEDIKRKQKETADLENLQSNVGKFIEENPGMTSVEANLFQAIVEGDPGMSYDSAISEYNEVTKKHTLLNVR